MGPAIVPWSAQVEGAEWLVGRRRAILADKQGSGKTVTALLASRDLLHNAWGLIVCSNRKRQDWVDHIFEVLGEEAAVPEPSDAPPTTAPWLVVNYQYVVRWQSRLQWQQRMVIADEAHVIRNRKTAIFEALRKVCGMRTPVVLVTATPMLNTQHDIWTLLNICDRRAFSSFWRFVETYFHVTTNRFGKKEIGDLRRPRAFDELIGEYTLARSRQEGRIVRRRVSHWMMGEQKIRYLETRRSVPKEREMRLAWLTMLRQLAVDPYLIDRGYAGPSKVDRLREVLDERESAAVVFCRQSRLVQHICREIDGCLPLYGSMSTTAQDETVERFMSGEGRALVVTHTTGGEGLNLTRADRAVFMDLAWHPGGNTHALYRIDRPGQTADQVEVIVIHTEESIEDDIWEIVRSKQKVTLEGILDRVLTRESDPDTLPPSRIRRRE